MALTVRELVTKLGFDVDQGALDKFDRTIQVTRKELEKTVAGVDKLADGFLGAGRRLTLFLTAPIVGLTAAITKAAADAEETESKFRTVFINVGASAERVAEDLRKNFGLARVQSRQLLADTGDLLVGFGFTEGSALELSRRVNELAVDLASFTNFEGGAAGASRALTKALLGEREAIKGLGIAVLEEDVKKQVALERSRGLTFATERQARANATLSLILQQTQKAQGDYARTLNSPINRLRRFRARVSDVAISFGKILLPALAKAADLGLRLADRLDKLSDGTKRAILIFAGLAGALGPGLLAIGLLLKAFVLLQKSLLATKIAFVAMGQAGLLANLKLLAIPLAILAVAAALALLIEDIVVFVNGGDSFIGFFDRWLKKMAEVSKIAAFFNGVLEVVAGFWTTLAGIFTGNRGLVVEGFRAMFGDLVEAVKTGIRLLVEAIPAPIRKAAGIVGNFLSGPAGAGTAAGVGGAPAFATGFGSPVSFGGGAAALATGAINFAPQVNANIVVPPGTPKQQVEGIREAVREVVMEENRRQYDQVRQTHGGGER